MRILYQLVLFCVPSRPKKICLYFLVNEILLNLQDTIITALRALAVLYENSYPCSNSVKQGLREILHQKFGGSHHDFTDKFLRPTMLLLERLKGEVNVT